MLEYLYTKLKLDSYDSNESSTKLYAFSEGEDFTNISAVREIVLSLNTNKDYFDVDCDLSNQGITAQEILENINRLHTYSTTESEIRKLISEDVTNRKKYSGSYGNNLQLFGRDVMYLHPELPEFRSFTLENVTGNEDSSTRRIMFDQKEEPNLYPIAVRAKISDSVFVVERPPFKFNVNFKPGRAHSTTKNYPQREIWAPWTVMIIDMKNPFQNMKMFANSGPLKSFDDTLLPMPFPNSYTTGNICFSNSLNDILENTDDSGLSMDGKRSLRFVANMIINDYYSGGWNTDLQPAMIHYSTYRNLSVHSERNDLVDLFLEGDKYKLEQFYRSRFKKFSKTYLNKPFKITDYYITANKLFKYFFDFMSALDLKETLEFYDFFKKSSGLKLEKSLEDYDHNEESHYYSSVRNRIIGSEESEYVGDITLNILDVQPNSELTIKNFEEQITHTRSYWLAHEYRWIARNLTQEKTDVYTKAFHKFVHNYDNGLYESNDFNRRNVLICVNSQTGEIYESNCNLYTVDEIRHIARLAIRESARSLKEQTA